jgi:hypothetical protein
VEAVEAENLIELAIAPGIPSAIFPAIGRGGEQRGEQLFLFLEFEEVGVPLEGAIILFDFGQPLPLEEIDRLQHDLAGPFIRIRTVVMPGIE